MTKNQKYIKALGELKKDLTDLRAEKIDTFENYWVENDHENIKALLTALDIFNKDSENFSELIVKTVETKGSVALAAPYICDGVLRLLNRLQLELRPIAVKLLEKHDELDKDYSASYKKLLRLDTKINRHFLEAILDE